MRSLFIKRMIALSIFSFSLQVQSISADIASHLDSMAAKKFVRVVFAQSESNVFGFPNTSSSNELMLLGYSTDTKSIDTLQSTRANYQRPLITHDGSRVVYSQVSGNTSTIYVINWEKNDTPVKITNGLAGTLFHDGVNEYIIYAANCGLKGNCQIKKINIDKPAEDSVIFNKTMISLMVNGHWLDVSADMKSIADVWGYGTGGVGVYDIASAAKIVTGGNGCWPSMPYDSTKRVIRLTDHHDGWSVHGLASSADTGTFGPYEDGLDHLKFASYSTDLICSITGNGGGSDYGGNITIWKVDSTLRRVVDSVTITSALKYGFPDLWAGDSIMVRIPSGISQKGNYHPVSRFSINTDLFNQKVCLYSSNGALVKKGLFREIKETVAVLPNGIYLVRALNTTAGNSIQRLTIIH